jgi:hypothetical protein
MLPTGLPNGNDFITTTSPHAQTHANPHRIALRFACESSNTDGRTYVLTQNRIPADVV